jgi:hypothetical protein
MQPGNSGRRERRFWLDVVSQKIAFVPRWWQRHDVHYQRRNGSPANVAQEQCALAPLVEACHRALDDLRRLEAKPVVGDEFGRNDDEASGGQYVLYRWRASKAGDTEERCYIVRLAEGGAH